MVEAKKYHTTSPRDLISAAVVSKRLGVTRPTIYTLVRTGKLPAVVFGTTAGRQAIRFQPEDVEEFIRNNYRGERTGR